MTITSSAGTTRVTTRRIVWRARDGLRIVPSFRELLFSGFKLTRKKEEHRYKHDR